MEHLLMDKNLEKERKKF